MDDIISSLKKETASVYRHPIKSTQSDNQTISQRQCENQLQYETYCALHEVVVQSSPWSLF